MHAFMYDLYKWVYGIDQKKKHLNCLQVLQNKCAWLILKQPSRTYASPLLQSLDWLPIEKRILSSSLSRLSKLSILVLVICLHIFNLVSTKLNTVSVRILPLHLRSLVPKNRWAIMPFLWLGLIFGMGCRAVSIQSIIWTG